MNRDELKKRILAEIKRADSRQELVEVIKKADKELRTENFSKSARDEFFGGVIAAAQANSATMSNSAEAQEIINMVVNQSK